jgi:peptide/nickel transport system ATP-binding protein
MSTKEAEKALLEVDGLAIDFHLSDRIVHAVRNVSFSIARGESFAILGESGSGKSVTAMSVMGLVDCPPGEIKSGRILYHGEDLLKVASARRRQINGSKIAMIFQDPLSALNPVQPVGWQITETFHIHGRQLDDRNRTAAHLLDRVGIPDAGRRIHDYPHQFSGGQRQRIMIAMAIALDPDLLIADEPTSALDVTVEAEILKLLRGLLAETGMGLILITHDLAVVTETADRVAVMLGGNIVEEGKVTDVFASPRHAYTRQLLEAVPGRHGFAAAQEDGRPKEVLLAAKHLSKTHISRSSFSRDAREVRAVDDVSFDVRAGESVGIVGESGSGKSTLARLILRLDDADAGIVTYRGADLAKLSKPEMLHFRRRVQVVFQDPTASLNPYMSVEQILTEPWMIHREVMPKELWRSEVAKLLWTVGLRPEHAQRFPHQFSGGQRQRIAIARVLAVKPEVIVCDEAVSALDVSLRAQILKLLKDLREEFHLSYVFIAHDLALVRDFCERVHVMYRGKFVEEGNVADVFGRPKQAYTRELLKAKPIGWQWQGPAEYAASLPEQ